MNTILATVTPEDLLRMEDEGKGYELVSGEPRELAVSKESSYVAGKIHYRIQQHCEARQPGWVFPEGTSYRCFPHDEDRVRRPDTSFIRLDRMTAEQYYEDGYCTIVPDLAVEVVSPNDNAEEVEEKNEDWLTAGVKVLLVVYPNLRLIRALRPGTTTLVFRAADTLVVPEVLPEFSCPVAELFRIPAATAAG